MNTIEQTHSIKSLFSSDLLYKEHLKRLEFSLYFTSVGFEKRELPSFILKIFFRLNQVFRNMFWFVVFLLSLILNSLLLKRSKFKDTFSLFGLSIAIFSLSYIILVVTTGSANVDRYSLFSDLVMYLSLMLLCYSINKLFPNQIGAIKSLLPIKNKA